MLNAWVERLLNLSSPFCGLLEWFNCGFKQMNNLELSSFFLTQASNLEYSFTSHLFAIH